MSASSFSGGTPSAAALEQALRKAVQRCYEDGNLEDLTVKRIRKAAETTLGLEEDFYKTTSAWKDKSKGIISSEVDACTAANPSSQPPTAAPTPKKVSPPLPQPQKSKSKAKDKKRKSTEDAAPKKRRRKVDSDQDVSDFDEEAVEEENPVPKKRKRHVISTLSPALEDKPEATPNTSPAVAEPEPNGNDQSESEMSVLIDEPPKSKGKPRKSGSEKPLKSEPKTKKKKSIEESGDPDQEEIKRLQGWLVKCGIRKMWWKELQPYETPRAKIKHLKEMLSEAGMTGRFSQEKATEIKEARELKADLEAVQEGAKIWGKAGEGDEDGASGDRPRRRVAKGLELDFLNSSDGEETS